LAIIRCARQGAAVALIFSHATRVTGARVWTRIAALTAHVGGKERVVARANARRTRVPVAGHDVAAVFVVVILTTCVARARVTAFFARVRVRALCECHISALAEGLRGTAKRIVAGCKLVHALVVLGFSVAVQVATRIRTFFAGLAVQRRDPRQLHAITSV
jgi:hypothetical protein